MHRDALAFGDEATDRIRRHWLAALGELRHQALHAADDEHAAFRALRTRLGLRQFGRGRRLDAAHGDLELAQVDLVPRHGDEELFGLLEAEALGECFQAGVRGTLALQLLLDHRAAGRHGFGLRLGVEPLPDLRPRLGALHEAALGIQPIARRSAGFRGDDLDALAALERRVERHDLAVDAGAAAAMPQVAVQRVREIDRRRARRQVEHLALWRQYIDRVVELGLFLGGARPVGHLVAPGEELAQPCDLLLERLGRLDLLLVAPVRG